MNAGFNCRNGLAVVPDDLQCLEIANGQPGASANDLTDERLRDAVSGNAALNGVPVEVVAV